LRALDEIVQAKFTKQRLVFSREAFYVTRGQNVFSRGFDPVESENACCQVKFRTGSQIFKMAASVCSAITFVPFYLETCFNRRQYWFQSLQTRKNTLELLFSTNHANICTYPTKIIIFTALIEEFASSIIKSYGGNTPIISIFLEAFES